MAEIAEIKNWETETPGERLFLLTYDLVKQSVAPFPAQRSGFVSGSGLTEFLRLVAAMELTHRCLNAAVRILETAPQASSDSIKRELRSSVELYEANGVMAPLAEQSRLAAIAYLDQKLTVGKKNKTHRDEARYCCWCGKHTSRTKGADADDHATVEHLWPEFLGGTSIDENLTIACQACNSARQHAFTWAWFGLQGCNEKLDSNQKLPRQLYLALGLHRLIKVASGQTRVSQRPVTLKTASKMLRGAFPEVKLDPGRRYTFFEILQLATE